MAFAVTVVSSWDAHAASTAAATPINIVRMQNPVLFTQRVSARAETRKENKNYPFR
jgi:hypothetical protein